ncbi:MAG: fructose-bisphosphatase class III [Ruminiclostridium sp.]|nr:fructose-bisphosphatase class III [Ruminiclostridium sp.]MBQ8410625.1 fructose-bisphosphatase class III [Ruminiclostridium sp.]
MHYVMSDIHGMYDKYIEMLDKIKLKDEDTLFILGDVVDRGDKPVEILCDMMSRSNVYPLMGNHDLLALDVMRKLAVEITENNYLTQIDEALLNELSDWQFNGGGVTLSAFAKLPKDELSDILDYMSEFSFYEVIDIKESTFILTHAGLGNFRKGKKISEYTPEELLISRPDPRIRYFDDESVFIVSGHTPTTVISGKTEIFKENGNICIDCGACSGGRLACFCLETFEEFYT